MLTSALNVYIRDVRYVVESAIVILFWLVPIFYNFSDIPAQYTELYSYNPVAALVMASRDILIYDSAPAMSLMRNLLLSSSVMLLIGTLTFRRLRVGFYNYL